MLLRSCISLFLCGFLLQAVGQDNFRESYRAKIRDEFPNTVQDFYAINARFDVQASYRLKKKGKIIAVPTSADQIKNYREYATLSFKIEGKKHRLTVYQPLPVLPLYRDLLFLPLKDLTAPAETYGGGRYLDLNRNDFSDGTVRLDFNRLYNPYCAFSDGWNCPIPPRANHLEIRLEAGEKIPLKTEYD